PTDDRVDTIYVKYFEEEVTSVDDPDIVDPEFGQETAIRSILRVLVKVEEGASIPTPAPGETIFEVARLNRRAGVTAITSSQIEDTRSQALHNFICQGMLVAKSTELGVPFRFTIEDGRARIADQDLAFDFGTVDPSVFEVNPNTTTLVIIDREGQIVLQEVREDECSTTDIHLALACIVSSDVGIL
ncbi:MAG: hypothetical protein IIB32_02205, partial [Chloroflexi bacterium]|nr:hypothetical protein [Chloroflexota bacterium]